MYFNPLAIATNVYSLVDIETAVCVLEAKSDTQTPTYIAAAPEAPETELQSTTRYILTQKTPKPLQITLTTKSMLKVKHSLMVHRLGCVGVFRDGPHPYEECLSESDS